MTKKSPTEISYETNRRIRRDWGEIKPTTRIIPDKRNSKKIKEKEKERRAYE